MTQPLLPDLPGFSNEQMSITNGVITVLACSETTSGQCPECAHLSSRIHSRYQRTLADLPWSGRTVRLAVRVHRFFCIHPTCPRKTFTEAIPAVAERYARRTTRLPAVLERLGQARLEASQPRAWRQSWPWAAAQIPSCACCTVFPMSRSKRLVWSV